MGYEHDLERELGYAFQDRKLFEEARTHASYANENGCVCNERLEFLGDAVLELCVSEILYSSRGDLDEGGLSKARSRLVRETTLASWARAIKLPEMLRLGRGLECQGGRRNQSIMADAMEAVLGAIFLDGGYEASMDVVTGLLYRMEQIVSPDLRGSDETGVKDAKSALQEMLQAEGDKPPVYRLTKRTGPDHAATYEVEASLSDGRVLAIGRGSSIKTAEFAAAKQAFIAFSERKRGRRRAR
ncbi:MAG: ribonuclease III [Synergistaceae bacterium]|jgi:ribonuclease-3|nr:ribonuclease III [Synergistaceae bacterium]